MWKKSVWDEMRRMQEEMDNMFRIFSDSSDSGFSAPLLPDRSSDSSLVESGFRTPLCDLCETDKEFIAAIELPGVDKKDIEIQATEDGVQVKVEKKHEKKEEDKKRGIRRYSYSLYI